MRSPDIDDREDKKHKSEATVFVMLQSLTDKFDNVAKQNSEILTKLDNIETSLASLDSRITNIETKTENHSVEIEAIKIEISTLNDRIDKI